MIAVTCRWCRRTLAQSIVEIRAQIYCPPGSRCAAVRELGAREPSSAPVRDALVMRLRRAGWTNTAIATLVNVTPTRVAQIVKERTA